MKQKKWFIQQSNKTNKLLAGLGKKKRFKLQKKKERTEIKVKNY